MPNNKKEKCQSVIRDLEVSRHQQRVCSSILSVTKHLPRAPVGLGFLPFLFVGRGLGSKSDAVQELL